ncbi:MAG: sulfotransferase, partial [Myxococcota bacterium]|nr:sulfotransferase [Myxococcota bacterium]
MTSSLPDFLLVGAMRAGTTSLHHILASRPDVFVPPAELFFFDSDDFEEHAESSRSPEGGWVYRDFESELEEALPRYRDHFAGAAPGQLVGEDSTTYLTSEGAPARIARMLPEVRILAILRDPVQRTWSHYWHLVSSGRSVLGFEDALLSQRGTLLKRSIYAPGIQRYLSLFPREQVKVVFFEELVGQTQQTVDRVCDFLGLEGGIDLSSLPQEVRHRHRGCSPASPRLQRAANWVRRQASVPRALDGPVADPTRRESKGPRVRTWASAGAEMLEGLAGRGKVQGYPDMHPQT